MNVIKRATLVAFWEKHPETKQPLEAWFAIARKASWRSTQDVLRSFPKAKTINRERVRFEVHGGNYRLIVAFKFTAGIAWVKFIGTHADYDRVDAATVEDF